MTVPLPGISTGLLSFLATNMSQTPNIASPLSKEARPDHSGRSEASFQPPRGSVSLVSGNARTGLSECTQTGTASTSAIDPVNNPFMPNSPLRGILFDKDGTLFDFQTTWKRVIETVLDTLAPDREARNRMAQIGGYDQVRGRFLPGSPLVAGSTGQIATLWSSFLPGLSTSQIERVLDDTGLDALADPDALFPAAADLPGLLGGLRASGYRLGVATHDSEQGARVQLRAAGAAACFDFIAGYDSGHGLKPGPGMLLAFAAATGIPPASVVMVGDSRHDLEVGRNAGAAMTVGVLTGPATHDDLALHADHILSSIEHLPALLAQWAD